MAYIVEAVCYGCEKKIADYVGTFYRYDTHHEASIFAFLKVGDIIRIEFYSDYGTTEFLKEHGHGVDACLIHIKRKKKRHQLLFGTQSYTDKKYRLVREG